MPTCGSVKALAKSGEGLGQIAEGTRKTRLHDQLLKGNGVLDALDLTCNQSLQMLEGELNLTMEPKESVLLPPEEGGCV